MGPTSPRITSFRIEVVNFYGELVLLELSSLVLCNIINIKVYSF